MKYIPIIYCKLTIKGLFSVVSNIYSKLPSKYWAYTRSYWE
jgi:hypothetical protein